MFIPEARLTTQTAVQALYAIGAHNAMGFSPFSIENVSEPERHPVAQSYEMLTQLSSVILAAQGKGTMTAAIPVVAFDGTVNDSAQRVTVGGEFALTVDVRGCWRAGNWEPGHRAGVRRRPGARWAHHRTRA